MKAKNWATVKELLQAALNVAPAERGKFLDQTGINGEIRREVESLLQYEQSVEGFMSVTASGYGKDFFGGNGHAENSLVGQQVGVYEIVGELGQGGMGAVYLAERKDGKFAQRVAVKMLKREFNTEKIRRNFNREKEILATLAHPNIATLIDAGTTVDGVPYLVMEYVEGVPIDEFCTKNALTLNERLKLFNRVCDAVDFAHRSLIVHRDLKPSNILVTKDSKPKLLDFGISKLLAASNDEHTLTSLGAMTPQYASPEQIRGETVTTATDIYSLGVVLFKLLTGNFPYNFNNKINGNLLKAITDSDPTLPSRTILADKYQVIKPILPAQLKGDLDNIVLKSLSKEPERRYKTVEQFSADIWRFADGLPVLARPNTFSYRASKFYGRNRVSVVAGILILLSLFAGIAVAVSQAQAARAQAMIASNARFEAEFETQKAKSEEEKAGKISQFMMKVLSYANPKWYAEGAKFKGDTKVIEVMDELGEKIDVEFANQPDIQAELHHKFAEVYGSQPLNEKTNFSIAQALYHARRALELRKLFYGERHELVAKDMAYLYWTGGVEEENEAIFLAEAIQMMRETNPHNLNLPYMIEAYTSHLILPHTEDTHETYRKAVIPPTDENKYQIAERYLLEALPIFREHYKEDNLAIYANECRLAYAQIKQNKFAEAEPHRQICLTAKTKLQDTDQLKDVKNFVSIVEEAAAEINR